MKKLIVGFVSALMFSISTSAQQASSTSQVPELPDYANWSMTAARGLDVHLTGSDADIRLGASYFEDVSESSTPGSSGKWELRRGLVVIKSPTGEPWLGLYSESRKLMADIPTTADINYYFYEFVNGKWNFVKDFSYVNVFGKTDQDLLQKDTDELLKTRYNLVILK